MFTFFNSTVSCVHTPLDYPYTYCCFNMYKLRIAYYLLVRENLLELKEFKERAKNKTNDFSISWTNVNRTHEIKLVRGYVLKKS